MTSYASLTGNQAIDLFRRLVDDQSVDDDVILDYLNTAQDELAMERPWVWLEAIDSSLSWATSDTYLTGHTYPTEMLYQTDVYVDGFDFPFMEVPLKMRQRYKDISYKCYFDHRQRKLFFTGNTDQTRTIYLSYIAKPVEIAADDTAISNWPGVMHRMLVYYAVGLWLGGTDADNITKLMRPEHAATYNRLKKTAVTLDAKLKGKSRNYQAIQPARDTSKQPDIVSGIE